MNDAVDAFINSEKKWQAEFTLLRSISLKSQLKEELKWGVPCYTINGKNVFLLHGFKDYCAILFVKGSLLSDKEKVLIQQTENVQAGRQIRFKNAAEINSLRSVIEKYIQEAIRIELEGKKVEKKKTEEFTIAPEFQARLDADQTIAEAFNALTPGRQRAYLLFFQSAKQTKTRESRIEKCIPRILDGLGLDD